MKDYSFIKPDPYLQNNLMTFSYDCGVGWHPIIEEAFDEIEEVINQMPEEDRIYYRENFQILQVKEKLGELKIYTVFMDDDIDKIISKAIEKASVTCEDCGKSGTLRVIHGWYRTNCDECHIKRLEKSALTNI